MDPDRHDYADPEPLLTPAWWESYGLLLAIAILAVVGGVFALSALWCVGFLR